MAVERRFRHVGYVVEDLDKALTDAKRLFSLGDDDIIITPLADVVTDTRFGFFSVGGLSFELIEPVTDRFRATLLDSGVGINHICFTVDDIDVAFADMLAQGARPGHVTPDGIIDMPGRRMVYFDSTTTGGWLIELIQDVA